MANSSGDYALAVSTAETVRRAPAFRQMAVSIEDLSKDVMSPLFQAVTEATEEAVYNAMFQAVSMSSIDP